MFSQVKRDLKVLMDVINLEQTRRNYCSFGQTKCADLKKTLAGFTSQLDKCQKVTGK